MLVIRLRRIGKKNQPSFKIVIIDKRKATRSGSFLEEVGFYNPLTKEKVLKIERVKYWLSKGVKPSPTIHNLLIKEKILEGKKIPVHKKSKKLEKKLEEVKPVEEVKIEGKPPKKAETEILKETKPQKEEKLEEKIEKKDVK